MTDWFNEDTWTDKWDGFMEWICRWFGHNWSWGLVYPNYCYRCGYIPSDEERYNAV